MSDLEINGSAGSLEHEEDPGRRVPRTHAGVAKLGRRGMI